MKLITSIFISLLLIPLANVAFGQDEPEEDLYLHCNQYSDNVFIYYDSNDKQAWYYRELIYGREYSFDLHPFETVDGVRKRRKSWDEDKQKVSSSFTASRMTFGPPVSERAVKNLIGVFGVRKRSEIPNITLNRLTGAMTVSYNGTDDGRAIMGCSPVDRAKFFEEMWREEITEGAIRRNRAF